jgi:NADPH-dependent ferric siderophore reductase
MRRVSLTGVSLTASPAQDVELILTEPTGRRLKRRYTIRNLRPDGFDVDAVLHGDAPGARWARTAEPGSEVTFAGPRGRLEPAAADWHLFVGDESALPAFAELAATLPSVRALVEVADAAEQQPLAADTAWLHRDGRPAGTADLLRQELERFRPPAGRGAGYLLGETRAMIALRPLVESLCATVYVKGYWNVGRQR